MVSIIQSCRSGDRQAQEALIAAALNIPEGTVKSRLNYARRAIKEGVERFAAQGVRRYGLPPLPFLVYFLRKDALQSHLSGHRAEALSRSVLTAGGAAAQEDRFG